MQLLSRGERTGKRSLYGNTKVYRFDKRLESCFNSYCATSNTFEPRARRDTDFLVRHNMHFIKNFINACFSIFSFRSPVNTTSKSNCCRADFMMRCWYYTFCFFSVFVFYSLNTRTHSVGVQGGCDHGNIVSPWTCSRRARNSLTVVAARGGWAIVSFSFWSKTFSGPGGAGSNQKLDENCDKK